MTVGGIERQILDTPARRGQTSARKHQSQEVACPLAGSPGIPGTHGAGEGEAG